MNNSGVSKKWPLPKPELLDVKPELPVLAYSQYGRQLQSKATFKFKSFSLFVACFLEHRHNEKHILTKGT
jgi:hypothetical protein